MVKIFFGIMDLDEATPGTGRGVPRAGAGIYGVR